MLLDAVFTNVYPDRSAKSIFYSWRVLSKAENNFSQLEKEDFAIIYEIRTFYDYLYSRTYY